MDPRLLQMYWVGTELRGLIRLPKEVRVLSCAVTFFDSASRRYSGSIRPIGEEDQANAYELSTNNVASGIELRDVSLSIFWADPSMRVTIDLAN